MALGAEVCFTIIGEIVMVSDCEELVGVTFRELIFVNARMHEGNSENQLV